MRLSSYKLSSRQAISAVDLLSFAYFSFGLRGEEIVKPRSKFGKFLSISFPVVLEITLRVLRKL